MAELITQDGKLVKVYGTPRQESVLDEKLEDQLRWAAIENHRNQVTAARAKMRNASVAIAISALLWLAAAHFLMGPALNILRALRIW